MNSAAPKDSAAQDMEKVTPIIFVSSLPILILKQTMESTLSSRENINKTDFPETEKFQKSDSTELVSVSL